MTVFCVSPLSHLSNDRVLIFPRTVTIGKPERQARKASHSGSKQQ